jgi:hypothetical protein
LDADDVEPVVDHFVQGMVRQPLDVTSGRRRKAVDRRTAPLRIVDAVKGAGQQVGTHGDLIGDDAGLWMS